MDISQAVIASPTRTVEAVDSTLPFSNIFRPQPALLTGREVAPFQAATVLIL